MVNQENSEIVRCNNCRTLSNESPAIEYGERTPCPVCGSLSRCSETLGHIARHYRVEINTALSVRPQIDSKAKRKGRGRPFIEQRSTHDLYRKTGQDTDEVRIIDRENNLYQKTIKDSKTGETIYECCEPLDKHTGHGYARHRGKGR